MLLGEFEGPYGGMSFDCSVEEKPLGLNNQKTTPVFCMFQLAMKYNCIQFTSWLTILKNHTALYVLRLVKAFATFQAAGDFM